ALGTIGADAAPAAEALAALLKDRRRGVREAAAVALLRIGKASVAPLRKTLRDEADAETRVLGLVALGAIGAEAAPAVETIVEALKDKDTEVRKYAARALGRIGVKSKEVTEALKKAAKDDNSNVQKAAQEALDRLSAGTDPEKK